MIHSWVLGSGGLLGAALCRTLQRDASYMFVPEKRFSWDNSVELSTQITSAVRSFAAQIGPTDRWEVYWAAGVGTMSSTSETFTPETHALSLLLQCIRDNPCLTNTYGTIAFASSAGAIYAGATDEIITEDTAPTPTTDYARAKLRQEDLIRTFALANNRISTVIARISTLYGPGQVAGKKQGLLTHIARCILRNHPIQIYVPYDTIRDYITADDAAIKMIRTLRITSEQPSSVTKIIAAEHPTTISEIISIFKRISRRKPLIVTSANKLSGLYTRRVQFRSVVHTERPSTPLLSLTIGISQLMTSEREAFARGLNTVVK